MDTYYENIKLILLLLKDNSNNQLNQVIQFLIDYFTKNIINKDTVYNNYFFNFSPKLNICISI